MRKALLIAWREYGEAVKSKGFIVGIALMPVLMFGSVAATTLLQNKVDTTDQKFAVVDRSGVLGPALVDAANKHDLK
jgi:ABC-type Na+ efflux pump permease subunit